MTKWVYSGKEGWISIQSNQCDSHEQNKWEKMILIEAESKFTTPIYDKTLSQLNGNFLILIKTPNKHIEVTLWVMVKG